MTNRREFLQTSASMSALPLANGIMSPAASAHGKSSVIPLNRAIFDDRYAEARSFGEAMGRLGLPVEALTDGDVTDIWLRERRSLRQGQSSAIAGTTQFGPMFVFEQLGKEHHMHVALRVEHQVLDDETLAHVMTGPPETLALAEEMRLHGAAWPEMMVALSTRCAATRSASAEHTIVMQGARPTLVEQAASHREAVPDESVIHYYTPQAIQEGHGVAWDGPLFSWVIAPAARVADHSASSRI